MDIPLPGEVIPFPSSPPNIPKSPPPIPPPPDFDHIPLPPTVGKRQSPPTVNHLPKAPPLPPIAPPLPPTTGKNLVGLPPLPGSQKGSSVEPKGNGEAILWQSIPPPPAPAPPPEDSRYSPSHATADEENERVLFPASLTMLPPPPPPSDHSHPPPSIRSSPNVPTNPPLPPNKPPHSSQPDPPLLPAPPPKTAVLGKTQAKKRLLAFSMTKHGGGQGLSFAIAKSTRVVNKASSNAFVGSGEDEEASEKKEVVNKSRKKKKEEREVLAIEEIKREEERLKEALGIRQQAQSAQQWAEDMWGISPPVHEMMMPSLSAPAAPSGEERDSVNAGEGTTLTATDATATSTNPDGAGAAADSHHNSELEANAVGDTVITESANTERGEGGKARGEGADGKEERKEGSERREKKGERSSRKKESGERGRRRDEDGGDKERSKRERGGSGRSGRERRSERKRESRRTGDGPPSGWKQIKEAGGEWSRERTSHRSREDRGRERRGSRSHRSRSRDQKRSGHSTHRSRSRSADGHRRPQASPFFIAKGAKHGEKEFPLRLLKHTKTRPPLSYCENPETAAPPQPTTRKEAFATEPPDVVNIMQVVTEASSGKDMEGKEQAAEPSGLAALRVSYEGGDEDEGDDETKRPDRPWFPDAHSFMSDSEARARREANDSLEEDGLPIRIKEEDISNEFDAVPDDALPGNLKNVSEDEEEENVKEEKVKDKRLLLNESESIVHSRWDSDPDSRGMSALETVEKSSNSPNAEEMQEKNAMRDERKRADEQHEYPEAREGSDSDDNLGSENSEDSEIEEKKGQQLASEYEEFMKAVSVGGEEDEAGDWGSGVDGEESGEDRRESDSSEHNSSKQNNASHSRSSDVEMGSDAHSSDDEPQNIAKHSSSESDNSAVGKGKSGSETKKRVFAKEKIGKKKDSGKLEESDGGGDSDGEVQVPRKKRKLSTKKTTGSGEMARKRGSEEKKKKLKVKEKSQKKKREKEKKRKKKKEKRKKRGRKKEDSSEVESESEEASDDGKVMSSGKSGRTKQKRLHKGEQSSDEATTDNSSDSSEEEEKKRKKRKKKRRRHAKEDGDRTKDEVEENVDEGKKSKVHSGKKKKGHESKNKRGGSDNSDCSEEKVEDISHSDEKLKGNAICDESVNGKENGIEEGSGKSAKKQKLKERGRKKKRKGSPINTKKHNSSRRRSPSTSDGSPTPGRGSHSRENPSKVQGRRGGTNESGQSSLDSNSSGGNKKPGESTESLRSWESSRVGLGRCNEEARTVFEKGREYSSRISTAGEMSYKEKKSRALDNKEKSFRHSPVMGKRSSSNSKRILTECSPNSSSSSSSPSSLSLSSVSSSSSSESSFSSQSDSTSSSTSSSSSSSPSSSSTSSISTSSSSESSSVSSSPCSPSSSKAEVAFCEESELLKDERLPTEISSKRAEICVSPESDPSFSPVSKEDFLEEDESSDNVSSMKLGSDFIQSQMNSKHSVTEDNEEFAKVKIDTVSGDSSSSQMAIPSDTGYSPRRLSSELLKPEEFIEPEDRLACKQVSMSETFECGQISHEEQCKDHSPVKSIPKLGSSESKFISDGNEPTFRESPETDMDGKSVTSISQRITALPSRPSRWDTRPVGPGMQAGSVGGKSSAQEWELPMSGLPVLPVPFPTCQSKPIEELPSSIQGVPKPVASPWGIEAAGNKSVLPSSDLSLNPIRGLADSTISDSELGGKCVGLGGQQQVSLTPSKGSFSVALERPRMSDHRTISSENDEMVELYPRESDHFVQPAREGVNVYLESRQQFHPADDRLMEHDAGGYSLDESCSGKKPESASMNFGAVRKDYEQAVTPETESAPTDWDDPEAFVGSGLGGIKSHVIQVGNFLQVVPSEQPIVSRAFPNPTPPVPAAVPLAVASSGVPLAPVPPAPVISGVPPVAAPITSASVTYPSPVAPLSSSFQSPCISSPSSSSVILPAAASPAVVPPLSVTPVSPSLGPVTSPVPSNIPTSIPTVASLIPNLTTAVPTLASPTPTLSQIPLLASLAPASSCAGISQLPLDPAAFLGSLISHALAFEKQQQTLLQSPSCSPLVVAQSEEVPKELPTNTEKEIKKSEKRKKAKANLQSTEKILAEDALSTDDPITRSIEDEYDIDPEDIALIQEAISKVPGEEEDFSEQNNKITRVKEKKKKARVGNTVFPPATRGILIPPGMREKPSLASGGANRGLNSGNQGQRKSVMFADGVRPGDGTSPSAGEDLPSPPPPVRKVPKEKRLRKKKKIKVKIIRQIRMESAEEDDDEDDDASPPPPPPGSPPPSLFLHHLSQQSAVGCDGAIPNPASHYPYPSAPTMPPTHMFSQLQAQQQLPPTPNAAHVATGGSAVLPPNALPPRIPQWAPCT